MSSIGAKAFIVIAARFATRFAQFASFIILARVLSPQGFGDYGVLTSAVFLVATIGNLGMRQALALSLGRSEANASELASSALLLWPFLSAASCVFVWYFNSGESTLLWGWQAASVYAAIFAVMAITLLQGVALGRGQAGKFAYLEAAPRVANAGLVIVLWLAGQLTSQAALLCFAISFWLIVPQAIGNAYKGQGWKLPRVEIIPSLMARGFLFAASLFLVMLQGRVGLFFLHGKDGATAAGMYFAAQRASEMFLDIATGVGLVLFSETARSQEQVAAYKSAAGVALGLFIAFSILGGGMAIFAPIIVQIVLGSNYAGAKIPLMILSLGLGAAAATRIMNSVVSGMGRPWLSAIIASVGILLNMLVCWLTIGKWGASGASLGLLAGQVTCCILYSVISRRHYKLKISDVLPDFRRVLANLVGRLAILRKRLRGNRL